MKQQERLELFAAGICDWFARQKRTLPWRDLQIDDQTQKAYMVLVSEVMLQQTQVSRVTVIFRQFLERFPTVVHLAAASNKEVIIAWKGMGYNSRALRLRDAAKTINEQFKCSFPSSLESLLSMKGIGKYTAAAIRNFAFDLPTPCVDTNIERILHRVFLGPEPLKLSAAERKQIDQLAASNLRIALEIAPKNQTTKDWHAALMDFGSLVCTKRFPKCESCPLSEEGICKSAYRIRKLENTKIEQKEPGRLISGRFVPNRLIRGRVVELLRSEELGATFDHIGRNVCLDWSPEEHREWLDGILKGLEKSEIIVKKSDFYLLRD